MKELNINVHHVTRVEGHGNITVNTQAGKVEEVTWAIPESPRFFEAMFRGKNYEDVTWMTPRICGICSIAHSTASIQATETAFGVEISEQTLLLRKLLFHAETLQSHVLHFYFLAAPDFLGVGSVFPLVDTHTEVVLRALRLKKLANDLADLIGGRKTHPLSCIVGGFARLPESSELKVMRQKLVQAMDDMQETVRLFKGLEIPNFTRETEYIALKDPDEYAFINGGISSTDTGIVPVSNYLEISNEFCVPQSTAKFSKHNRDSYMVGALARFNNNARQLLPAAQKAAEELGLKAVCHNPYMISIAQIVETIHVIEDAISLIDKLTSRGLREEKPPVKVRAGRGIGAVEAPRGILFHDYTYDDKGTLINANCVIPTNQNHNNIQKDMEVLVPEIIDRSQEEITLRLEMLVRAYDPCISCSTHFLKVKFTQ
jgi:coenzyme F420-reducing hydrogenase alpha subunit